MSEIVYTYADAWLDDQITVMGDWRAQQWITLELVDEDETQLLPASCALSSQEARDLAFRLLVLAEHADRRADGTEDVA